eukprot:6804357-Prorocentrum_lima.AAC.1
MSVSRCPATLSQLGTWLEDYIHKLDFGMIFGASLNQEQSSQRSRIPWTLWYQMMRSSRK